MSNCPLPPIIRYSGHILYGICVLEVGNIRIVARAPGQRGQGITFLIRPTTNPLSIDVTSQDYGIGDIIVSMPANVTELQLIEALMQDDLFPVICNAELIDGADGSAIVNQTFAKSNLPEPDGGFIQWVSSRLNIIRWNERDLRAVVEPVGLLYMYHQKVANRNVLTDVMQWTGEFQIGIAFQHNSNFELENVLADL